MDEQKKLTRKIKIILLTVGTLFVLVGIFYFFSLRTTNDADEIIARVGNEVITRHDVEIRIRQSVVSSQKGGLSVPEDALFDRSLDDLITESLLFQDALRNGFSVNEEIVNWRYETAEQEYKRIQKESGSTQTFLERMAENLMTPEDFRRNIGRQLVLFTYMEDIKRQEVDDILNAAIAKENEGNNPYLEITSERTQLTSEEIARISLERAEVLREEFLVEIYLK